MLPRRTFALAILAACAAATIVSGTVEAARHRAPPAAAGIAVSNRLTPLRDARVVVSTLTPRTGWAPPYVYRVELGDKVRGVVRSPALIVTDTVRDIAAPCVRYRITARPVGARDSLTRSFDYCRTLSVREVALRDSFADTWMTGCYQRHEYSDTIPVGVPIQWVLRGRNRYTGRVVALVGTDTACRR